MADFNYVTWTSGTPAYQDYLAQMSENDQYLKDLLDASPRGILGWAEADEESTNTTKKAKTLKNMGVTVTIGENRLFRVSYQQKAMKNSEDMTTLVALFTDNTQLTSTIMGGKKEINTGPHQLFYVYSPTAGEHTYKVRGRILNGTGGTARFRATAASPRQLIVEDLGASVAPQ